MCVFVCVCAVGHRTRLVSSLRSSFEAITDCSAAISVGYDKQIDGRLDAEPRISIRDPCDQQKSLDKLVRDVAIDSCVMRMHKTPSRTRLVTQQPRRRSVTQSSHNGFASYRPSPLFRFANRLPFLLVFFFSFVLFFQSAMPADRKPTLPVAALCSSVFFFFMISKSRFYAATDGAGSLPMAHAMLWQHGSTTEEE